MPPANTQFAVALHMMAVLGCHSDPASAQVTSSLLAQSVNTSPSFVRRTLSLLAKAGLVKTSRGASGFCTLARSPEEILMLDIYRAVNAPKVFALHSYPPQECCSVSCQMNKVMEELLNHAQGNMEESLRERTLANFIRDLRQ